MVVVAIERYAEPVRVEQVHVTPPQAVPYESREPGTHVDRGVVVEKADLGGLAHRLALMGVELDEGRDRRRGLPGGLVQAAVLTVFRERCPMEQFRDLLLAFDEGTVVHTGDDVASADYIDVLTRLPALREPVDRLSASETPAAVASALEFVLEGLHLSKRLNKEAAAGKAEYRGRG